MTGWATPYDDATAYFREACGGNDPDHCQPLTEERTRKWQEAGALYEGVLDPSAAMKAAFCFTQVGDTTRAILDYDRVIHDYGKEESLSKLQAGAPAQ